MTPSPWKLEDFAVKYRWPFLIIIASKLAVSSCLGTPGLEFYHGILKGKVSLYR
jgi:hypothetical protein